MMAQLGIRTLRPGPSGNESAPNQANYDEAKANPYPNLPEVLTLENGKKVTTADAWWKQRLPQILETFEREVIGRVPRDVPKVTWSVVNTTTGVVGRHSVVAKQLVGHVENATHPSIAVDIQMALVLPTDVVGPVPIMMMFGGGSLPQSVGGPAPPQGRGGPPPMPGGDPPATEQLIAAGWGFASISPTSIQADNGAELTRGIIGLVNKGHFRKPDDWGALRAWAWGASPGLDYLATDTAVDAKRVGIEGVSRYGKAALVTMAFGAKDLGTSDDYKTEKMPAVNVGMLDGQLAWRQHDGGHTDGPNWKSFIPWADRELKRARR